MVDSPVKEDHEIELMSKSENLYYSIRNSTLLKPVFDVLVGSFYSYVWAPKYLKDRVEDIVTSDFYIKIPKHEHAGSITKGLVIMHNGLKVNAASYYGQRLKYVFSKTKGVHEPREEYWFHTALKDLADKPVMVELGSYWAFYSLWFKANSSNGRAIMIEPDQERMKSGVLNFELNGLSGEFTQAYAGQADAITDDGVRIYSLAGLRSALNIEQIDILHVDIQGSELELLEGGRSELIEGRVSRIFLSTHSDQIHAKCMEILQEVGFDIVDSMGLDVSDSVDGFIYATKN